MAHSMGGAIATRYIQLYPNDFDAAAITSPLYGLSFMKCFLSKVIPGRDTNYILFPQPFDRSFPVFEKNEYTQSPIRFKRTYDKFMQYPETQLGGVSKGWIKVFCEEFKQIFNDAGKIQTPSLIIRAGNDKIVSAEAQEKFVKLNNNISAVLINDAKHELLMEKDEFRIKALKEVLKIFSEN